MFNIARSPNNITSIQSILSTVGAYKDLDTRRRNTIRALLVEDQGEICCYCERQFMSINREAQIEHFSDDETHDRDARNLNNACKTCNDEKWSARTQLAPVGLIMSHCFNPSNGVVENLFSCMGGIIHTEDTDFHIFLNSGLKLNNDAKCKAREICIDSARALLYNVAKKYLRGEIDSIPQILRSTFFSNKHPYNAFIRKNLNHIIDINKEELLKDGFSGTDISNFFSLFLLG